MSSGEATVTNALLAIYVVVVIVALWAYYGLVRYYIEENGKSSAIWTAMIVMAGLSVFSALLSLPIAAIALFDLPRLPFTGIAVILVVIAQVSAVIVYRLVFGRIRRSRGQVSSVHEKEGDHE